MVYCATETVSCHEVLGFFRGIWWGNKERQGECLVVWALHFQYFIASSRMVLLLSFGYTGLLSKNLFYKWVY